jgi:hypothetical protein
VDNRFSDLNFWLQMTFGAIFATLGMVVLQWATTIRRATQLTERLERVEQALQKG